MPQSNKTSKVQKRDPFSTYGNFFYTDREMKMICVRDVDTLEGSQNTSRFRIIFIKSGHTTFTNGNKTQLVTSPAVITLDFEDKVTVSKSDDLKMDIIYFSPFCFDRYDKNENYEKWR